MKIYFVVVLQVILKFYDPNDRNGCVKSERYQGQATAQLGYPVQQVV